MRIKNRMIDSIPYASARYDVGLQPGAGPMPVAEGLPASSRIAHSKELCLLVRTDPSQTARKDG